MAEATTQEITTNDGTRFFVRVWETVGDTAAPCRDVLLLHGWPNSSRVWQALADQLLLAAAPAVSLRLVAPDLRGFGDSDKPAEGYTCEQFAEDALNIADALHLQNYLLVGHSMSGKIGQLVATKQPAGLSALALVTPGMLAPSPPADVSARIGFYGDAEKTKAMLTGWAAHPLSEAAVNVLTEDGLRTGREAWNSWLQVMRNEDLSTKAAKIAVPTLVIGTSKDPLRTEEEFQDSVVKVITGAQYARVPGSGHLPHLEDPITLAALLINFLDGLPKGVTQ